MSSMFAALACYKNSYFVLPHVGWVWTKPKQPLAVVYIMITRINTHEVKFARCCCLCAASDFVSPLLASRIPATTPKEEYKHRTLSGRLRTLLFNVATLDYNTGRARRAITRRC